MLKDVLPIVTQTHVENVRIDTYLKQMGYVISTKLALLVRTLRILMAAPWDSTLMVLAASNPTSLDVSKRIKMVNVLTVTTVML